MLEEWSKRNGGNNLIPDLNINLDMFYAYLDSLTILQELALIHTIIF